MESPDSEDERNGILNVQNQPYDEALEIPDGEEVASEYSPTPRVHPGLSRQRRPPVPPASPTHSFDASDPAGQGGHSRGDTPPEAAMSDENDEEFEDNMNPPPPQQDPKAMQQSQAPKPQPRQPPQQQFDEDEDDDDDDSGSETDDDDDDDDDDEDDDHVPVEGAYDPGDYENLPVTPEIKEMFQYITRYTPQTIELDHSLLPFIPDLIPAVGDIDAFLKITRPDNRPDTLGLTVLDEPCAKQSDPTVLDLQLRAISKQTTDKKVVVKSIDNAEKNPKQIESWIESIRELHRTQPPPNVHYSKNMPDIDTLMQEWPPEFEELLKEVGLPTAELDCDLPQYVELICSILDIPVYKGSPHHNEKIQALHVLFTLFSEFKNSQHFRALAQDNQLDNALKGGGGAGEQDDKEERLIL
ncbi:intraflagellar transport protein 46 homolog isoform X1 [Saccostrea cucullata]|uniref:intraflagellar transport protein 46 homolog isoform X1 n=1 Tax=Saccostrea cuccullata TaxID=36930 RepID=UPI002ED2BBB9